MLSTAAARCASSARRSWNGRALAHRRPSQRRRLREPLAGVEPARPAIPRAPVRAEADLGQDPRHRLGVGHRPPRLEGEGGPDARHHRPVHHRLPAPRRLDAGQQLAAPVQLLRGPAQRVVQRPLRRQDVDEAEVEPVHRHRPGHGRERVEAADLPEPPARVARLLQQRQRQPAGRAQVPPPLLGHPLEVRGLRQHAHPADAEELVEIAVRDGRVEIGAGDRRADARERDLDPVPVLRSQISGLRHRRRGDRRQVGQELGVLGPHRLHHHRVGGADEGAPRLLFPQLKVFRRNEFVADDAAGDGPEPGLVAGVDQLLGRGRVEVGHRLGAEDEHPLAPGRDGKSPADLAVYVDRAVRAGREALPAADAGLVHHLQQQRLIPSHGNGIRRADPDARQTGDTALGIDDEIQGT